MYRIDNATSADALPTPAAPGVNPNGYFTGGDPDLGVPATVVTADWANAVQEELAYFIEQAGLSLDKADPTQLKQAFDIMKQSNAGAYGTSSTAANTYAVDLTPVPTSYTAGMLISVKFTNHNTGAATINVNSLGAKSIKNTDGSSLSAYDIYDGMVAVLLYDGTNFQLINANSKLSASSGTGNLVRTSGGTLTAPIINQIMGSISSTPVAAFADQVGAVNYVQLDNTTSDTPTVSAKGTGPHIILGLLGEGNGGAAVQGKTSGVDYATGYVTETITSIVNLSSGVSLTDNIASNVTSISLTPGDYDIDAIIFFNNSAAATLFTGGINTTSSTVPNNTVLSISSPLFRTTSSISAGVHAYNISSGRLNISVTTTVYLVSIANFSSGTCTTFGWIKARRR
jgi:hypothetical protein